MAPADDASGPARPGKAQANHRRVLRAVFAADIAGFSGQMSLNETTTVTSLSEIMTLGREVLDRHDGWLFGMPGDGLFALFESAVSAVQCGLQLQQELAVRPRLAGLPMRVGIHLGEVLIENEIPYGEALNIAARLESLADPGSILVSGTVMDAVSSRISATFEDRGVPQLKNIPRRIPTYSVKPPPPRSANDEARVDLTSLDRTTRLDRNALREVLDMRRAADAQQVAASAASPKQDEPNTDNQSLPPGPTSQPVAREPAANAAPTPAPAPAGPSEELLVQLKSALATHLGPLAKLIVDREMKAGPGTSQLVAKLSEHIPNEVERKAFLAVASRLTGAAHSAGDGRQ